MTKSELILFKESLEKDIQSNIQSIERSKRSIEQCKALNKFHRSELNEVYAGLVIAKIKELFGRKS